MLLFTETWSCRQLAYSAGSTAERLGAPKLIVDAVADEERWDFVLQTLLVQEVVFWTFQAMYFFIDHFDLMPKFRIAKRQPYPSRQLIIKCIHQVLVDHFISRPVILFLAYPLFAFFLNMNPKGVPSPKTLVWQILVCTQIDDFLFYWSHRLAHHRYFYAWIHKQHHEFKYCLPIAVEYAHPLEDIFVNSLSSIGGPLVLRGHVSLFWIYTSLKVWQSIDAHSSYALPFPLSPWTVEWLGIDCSRAHDFHHSHNVGMFGGYTRLWDHLMGTDAHYVKYRAKEKTIE